MQKILFLFCLIFMAGCSVMPYKSQFTCPQAEKGTCAPVKQVYQSSLNDGTKDNQKYADADIQKLLQQLKICSKSDDRKCINKVTAEIEKKFASAVQIGRKQAKTDMAVTIDDFRLKNLEKTNLNESIEIKPIVMKILFAKYRTKEGLLVGEHAIYKVVSTGDWIVDFGENKIGHSSVGKIY